MINRSGSGSGSGSGKHPEQVKYEAAENLNQSKKLTQANLNQRKIWSKGKSELKESLNQKENKSKYEPEDNESQS